jgi:hypothetical protein
MLKKLHLLQTIKKPTRDKLKTTQQSSGKRNEVTGKNQIRWF